MNPLENLSRDHGHISLALDAMDARVGSSALSNFDLRSYEQIVDFIEFWADGAHYEKEEHLFAALDAVGIPRGMGPTAFLELEHRATRDQTARLRQAIADAHAGHAQAQATLLDAVARYSAVVRMHMPKEDLGYFPMAATMLSQSVLEGLGQHFEAIDARLPASFAQAAQALHQPPPEQISTMQLSAPVIPNWHETHDRQLREIVRTVSLGTESGSAIRVSRRRRPLA